MKVTGLFAGIGGFEVGLGRAGHETIELCEVSGSAQQVLQARFPGVPLSGDVRSMDAIASEADVVCAGFPCQDLSMAGPKAGIDGARSGLVDEVFRLVGRSKPAWLILENVYFLRHLAGGKGMEHVVSRMENLGYRWAYRLVDTQYFGLPQRRQRIFFVASRDEDPTEVLFADEGQATQRPVPNLASPIGFYWTEGRSGAGLMNNCLPTVKAGSGIGIPSPPAVLLPDGRVCVPTVETAEMLQGFDPGWTDLNEGFASRERWGLIGNAVSSPVAAWIGMRLSAPGARICQRINKLKLGDKWPAAAEGDGKGRRWAVSASVNPLGMHPAALDQMVGLHWNPISRKALTGFVSRAREGSLKFPEGFLDRLEHQLLPLNGIKGDVAN